MAVIIVVPVAVMIIVPAMEVTRSMVGSTLEVIPVVLAVVVLAVVVLAVVVRAAVVVHRRCHSVDRLQDVPQDVLGLG